MKHILYFFLFLIVLIVKTSAVAVEKTSIWSDVDTPSTTKQARNRQQGRWLMLDARRLLEQLNTAPDETGSQKIARQVTLQIALPLPSGETELVSVETSSIMESALTEKYPQMQTWKVHGTDNVLSGRLDFTPAGFHAILSLTNGEMVFIDPEIIAGTSYYLSQQRPSTHSSTHQCKLNNTVLKQNRSTDLQPSLAKSASSVFQTYRLAVATTGEYTHFFGGTVAEGLAAVVTTINRVNEIYERDLSIRLILVAQNDQIIYTNSFFDPYTNSSSDQASDENQINLDDVIGRNHYDIGHVFGTGEGGIAVLDAACQNGLKAIGATGLASPNNDVFYIDFVAHELGHQLGAEHTFNGTKGNCAARNASTAYEPGSGSTIMAYAGICGADNLQKNTDAVFHSASIQQIMRYTREGKGASCAKIKTLNNTQPEVDAGKNYTLPARTPFLLSARATDADNDALTYAWDQMDLGAASSPDIDKGSNPIIRSYLPSKSAQRSIPKLSDVLAGTKTKGEILPTTSRTLKFNVVVRDGKGGVASDGIQLRVHDTGSAFSIREPNASTTIKRKQKLSIVWNVANTDASPINCAKVDIALSTNGGEHFAMLKRNVQNDGSEEITIPAETKESTRARLKISCSNNIFFALSPANFTISDNAKETPTTKKKSTGLILPQLLLLFLLLACIQGIRRFKL